MRRLLENELCVSARQHFGFQSTRTHEAFTSIHIHIHPQTAEVVLCQVSMMCCEVQANTSLAQYHSINQRHHLST